MESDGTATLDYLYEPDAAELIEGLIRRYLEGPGVSPWWRTRARAKQAAK